VSDLAIFFPILFSLRMVVNLDARMQKCEKIIKNIQPISMSSFGKLFGQRQHKIFFWETATKSWQTGKARAKLKTRATGRAKARGKF